MNKKNLLYVVLLLPAYLQSMSHKSTAMIAHQDVVVKHVTNETDYPIKVVKRSNTLLQDTVVFKTLQPHTKALVNIKLKYEEHEGPGYEQLGFRWIKPDAPDAHKPRFAWEEDYKNLIQYTPSGNTQKVDIKLVEDSEKPGNLKIIKYLYHKKHKHHHNKHKHPHKHKHAHEHIQTHQNEATAT